MVSPSPARHPTLSERVPVTAVIVAVPLLIIEVTATGRVGPFPTAAPGEMWGGAEGAFLGHAV